MSGRKSTIEDKWKKRKSNGQIRNGHMASEMTSHLTTIFSQPVWGEGKERETDEGGRERRDFRVRRSHFSLDFPVIGPVVFDGARGKELPHDKSY